MTGIKKVQLSGKNGLVPPLSCMLETQKNNLSSPAPKTKKVKSRSAKPH